MLEADDDVWKKLAYVFISLDAAVILILPQNFMKCLMRMFAEEDQGVFSLKQ